MYPLTSTIAVAMLLQRTTAQFPAQPTDLTIAKSSISGAVTVSFKEVRYTTYPASHYSLYR